MKTIVLTLLASGYMAASVLAAPPGPPPFERILDQDQRAELREAFRANHERLREIEQGIRAGRQALQRAIFEEQTSETELKQRIESIAKLEAEREFIRVRALARIRSSLTPEQMARLKEFHAARPGTPGNRPGLSPEPRRKQRPSPGAVRPPVAPRPEEGELPSSAAPESAEQEKKKKKKKKKDSGDSRDRPLPPPRGPSAPE